MADGTVVKRADGWPGAAIGILHESSRGRFLAVYGHIESAFSGGEQVSAGQRIGTLTDQGNNTHLHLGIRPLRVDQNPHTVALHGNVSCAGIAQPNTFGYVNPIPWLAATRPAPSVSRPVFTEQTPTSPTNVGDTYRYWFRATGDPSPTFETTNDDRLPPGLTLNRNGLLSGHPTRAGLYEFQVRARNSVGSTLTEWRTIRVNATLSRPVFTDQTPPSPTSVGDTYRYWFRATGDPAPTFETTNDDRLPPGLTLNRNGLLSGHPTRAGLYEFQVRARNSVGSTLTEWRTIRVNPAEPDECPRLLPVLVQRHGRVSRPVFTDQTPPSPTSVGDTYRYWFRATGEPAPTFETTNDDRLPPGLTLSPDGLLSGHPTRAGLYEFQVRARNSVGSTLTEWRTIRVNATLSRPVFTDQTPPSPTSVGDTYRYWFRATGEPAPTFETTNDDRLPPGLTLSPDGLLSGHPTRAGLYEFQVRARNSVGSTLTEWRTIRVNPAEPDECP